MADKKFEAILTLLVPQVVQIGRASCRERV